MNCRDPDSRKARGGTGQALSGHREKHGRGTLGSETGPRRCVNNLSKGELLVASDVAIHHTRVEESPRSATPRRAVRQRSAHGHPAHTAPCADRPSLSDRGTEPELNDCRLGLVTDRLGHVHLMAVGEERGADPRTCIDMLAAVGAASSDDLDSDRLIFLSPAQLAHFELLVDQYIDDARLRNGLLKLINLSRPGISNRKLPS
jgi:hypothetical protein